MVASTTSNLLFMPVSADAWINAPRQLVSIDNMATIARRVPCIVRLPRFPAPRRYLLCGSTNLTTAGKPMVGPYRSCQRSGFQDRLSRQRAKVIGWDEALVRQS